MPQVFYLYLSPKIFETTRCQFRIADRRLDRPVSQVALQRPRIGPPVRENIAGRVSEHVGVEIVAEAKKIIDERFTSRS